MLARRTSRVSILVAFMVAIAAVALAQTDSWTGAFGDNWNIGPNWTSGVPMLADDVLIYSGGNDNVILDMGSTTINSLALGGALNGTQSELQDGGTAQTLNITNALTVGQTGVLIYNGGGALQIGGDVTNSGMIQLTGGSTLNTTGTLTNQAEGFLAIYSAGTVATLGGLSNSGYVDVDGGGTLTINGNVSTSGSLGTDVWNYGGGNTLNITGTLTTQAGGVFALGASGDVANVGALVNNGSVNIYAGATLNLTNQPGGITDVVVGSGFGISGIFTAGLNSAFANLTSIEGDVYLSGQNGAIIPNGGTLTITGGIGIYAGSMMNVTGNVLSSGDMDTGGGSTLNISGTLTNNAGAVVTDNGSSVTVAGNLLNTGSIYTGLNGGGNTLTILGTLTNNNLMELRGSGDIANVGTLANSGDLWVYSGATLNLTNQPSGITDVVGGSAFIILGTFTAAGKSSFANLNSNEGEVYLLNGQETIITPSSGRLHNDGTFTIDTGSADIVGDVLNNGDIADGPYNGGATLNIRGTLTNTGEFGIYHGSAVNISGDLLNSGSVELTYTIDNYGLVGSTLNVT